jgi:fibronectin-binding autotransporter adhesin
VVHGGLNNLTLGNASCLITGPGTLTKSGPGVLVLAGNNTYLGNTNVTAGTLQLALGTALPDGEGKGILTLTSPGLLNLNAQSETINGLSGNGTVDNLPLGPATLTVGAADATSTFNGILQNTGDPLSLVKTGAGTLTLTGISTHSGTTTINAGRISGTAGGSAANSTLILATAAAVCETTIPSAEAQWKYAAMNTDAAGTLDFKFTTTAPSPTVAPLVITGAANFTVTPLVVVSGSNLSTGLFPLMAWASTTGTPPTAVSLPPGVTGTIGLNGAGTQLVLNITGINSVLRKANNTANLNLPSSWTTGIVPGPGNIAPWDSTVTAANTVALGAATTWQGIRITDPGGPVTIDGPETLTLGAAPIDLDLAVAAADLTLNAPLAAGATQVWDVAASRLLSLNNTISGNGPLIKQGAGSVTLAGANVFTGGLTLTAGILNLNHPAALGDTSGTLTLNGGSLDNKSGAELFLTSNNPQAWNGDFTFTGTDNLHLGTGAVTLSSDRTVTVLAKTLTAAGDLGGGAVSLTKAGDGTLVLAGTNTFTGQVNVNAGTLTLSAPNAFSNGLFLNAGRVNLNDALAAGTGTLTIAAGTQIGNTGSPVVLSTNNAQSWNGDWTYSGPATLDLGPGPVTLSGTRTVTVNAGLTVGGVISGGGLNKQGTAPLILTGANDFTGAVVLGGGGAVRATTLTDEGLPSSLGAAVGNASIIQIGASIGNGALEYIGTTAASTNRRIQIGVTGSGSLSGTISNNSPDPAHTLTFSNPLFNRPATNGAFGRGFTLGGSNTGDNTIVGDITDNVRTGGTNGKIGFAKTGSGTWKLSGKNSWTGNTNVSGGILRLGSGTALPDGLLPNPELTPTGNLILNGTLDLNGFSETINGLSGAGIIDTLSGGTPTLTVGSLDQTGVFGGTLQNTLGTLSLTKIGTGTLDLTGINTHTGTTEIAAGTLVVNGNSLLDTGLLVIAAGAKLSVAADETVNTLYFGTLPQPAGTYGSTTSAATNKDDTRFAGTGILTVLTTPPPATAYQVFVSGLPNPAARNPQADPDLDGIANAVEFVLGGNPATVEDSTRLPVLSRVTTDLGAGSRDYLKFSFSRTDLSAYLNPSAEYDPDLTGTWTTALNGTNGVVIQTTDAGPADTVDVYLPASLAPGGTLFARLRVTVP